MRMKTVNHIPKHTGFKSPPGYLENFEVDFNREMAPVSIKTSGQLAIWAVAASIVVWLGFLTWQYQANELDQEEIAYYLLEETDVDVFELVEIYGLDPLHDFYDLPIQSIETYLTEETIYTTEFLTSQ